ncbi:MAG: hypothetical protein AABO58_25240 [Acidobacteriota bacterium]
MTLVYYAMGGGLGHLTRARAFLHTLGLERDAVIVAESPFAGDRRVVGDIPVLRERPEGQLILDTFPGGLFGEIEGGRVDYVARYVRWDRYELPKDPPRIGRAYILEPLHLEQDRYVRERAEEVIEDFELRDPPAAQDLPPLPPTYALVVHSGPQEEIDELLAYARDVCLQEGVADPIVAPDVYPATLIAAKATRIFTGGGFNAMRQFGCDPRHRPLPFERRFDDQYGRVARMRTSESMSAVSLARASL